MNLHTVRSGGFAGIAFIVLIVLSVAIPGVLPPDNSASPQEIGAFADAHRVALLIAGWLGIPSVALFVWFAVGLYRWLISVSATNDEGAPLFALINGVIASAIAAVSSCLQLVLVFHGSADLGPQLVRALFDMLSITGAVVIGLSAFFFFGASLSGARHGSLPSWLCWLGYLVALANLAASVSCVYKSGPMALGTILPGFVLSIVPFAIWILLAAIVMIGKGTAAAK
jgi:hypothetical protein